MEEPTTFKEWLRRERKRYEKLHENDDNYYPVGYGMVVEALEDAEKAYHRFFFGKEAQ